jgi:hypothetical protein
VTVKRVGIWCLYLVIALSLSGCGAHEAEIAKQGRSGLVGLSQSDIRMCAGLATKTEKDKAGDIWMYEHGTSSPDGMTPTVGFPFAASVQFNAPNAGYCRVQLRFVKDRVAAVEYAGETDMMGHRDAVCAQMIRTCMERYARRY